MISIINYYKVLEVDYQASPEVIEKAYKALSMKYHPDRQPPSETGLAVERMQSLNEAYSVLSDPNRRREYDGQRMYWRIWLDDGLLGLAKLFLSPGFDHRSK